MTNNALSDSLSREVASRIKHGMVQITLTEFEAGLREIGYRLDRDMDCKGLARHMTGDRAGESYPSCGVRPVQLDDGVAWCNVDARRDENFDKLKQFRNTYFAVSHGYIYEF